MIDPTFLQNMNLGSAPIELVSADSTFHVFIQKEQDGWLVAFTESEPGRPAGLPGGFPAGVIFVDAHGNTRSYTETHNGVSPRKGMTIAKQLGTENPDLSWHDILFYIGKTNLLNDADILERVRRLYEQKLSASRRSLWRQVQAWF